MTEACAALSDAAAQLAAAENVSTAEIRVPHIHRPLTLSDLAPGWRAASTLVASLAADAAAFIDALAAPVAAAEQRAAAAQIVDVAEQLEAALCGMLKWGQSLPPPVLAADEEAPNAAVLAARLASHMAASASCGVVSTLAECLSRAVALASIGGERLPAALHAQLRHLAGMATLTEAALRAIITHSVLLHSSLSHLTLMSAAIFVAYMRDGFGKGEGEEAEGEGDGEGGTGEGGGCCGCWHSHAVQRGR